MPKPQSLLICLVFAANAAVAGQLYRWVDERGRVYYSDQPPPPKAREAQALKPRPNVVETDKEGFELRRAREVNPVRLFITDCGEPCDQARDFLTQRKIPFTRMDPQRVPEDAVALKQLIGALEVPVIQVGAKYQKGFDPAAWESLLSAAGYPVSTEATGR